MSKLDEHLPYAIRQFDTEIVLKLEIFGYDISLNTASTAKIMTALLISTYLIYAIRERSIVPRRLQMSAELLYGLITRTVLDTAGEAAKPAIPFVFTMFTFVLFGTLLGLTPIKETFTAHLVVTLALALTVFAYVNVLAFKTHGIGFLKSFLPPGVPIFVAPILLFVELVSYLFRPITLGFRLFANIFAGHVMLKLFADFSSMLVTALGSAGVIAALLPVAVSIVLIGFEIMIVCIQAYIFMLITSMYIRDSLRGH